MKFLFFLKNSTRGKLLVWVFLAPFVLHVLHGGHLFNPAVFAQDEAKYSIKLEALNFESNFSVLSSRALLSDDGNFLIKLRRDRPEKKVDIFWERQQVVALATMRFVRAYSWWGGGLINNLIFQQLLC